MKTRSLKFMKSAVCFTLSLGLALSLTACNAGQSAAPFEAAASADLMAESSVSDASAESLRESGDSVVSDDRSNSAADSAVSSAVDTSVSDLKGSPVRHELEFGGCFTDKTIEEFNTLGF